MTNYTELARRRRDAAVAELKRRQNNLFIERRHQRPARVI